MRFLPFSTSGLAENGCRWPIVARSARIILHSCQQTGAEYYGTSADDRNTLLPVQGEMSIRHRRSPGEAAVQRLSDC